METKTAFLAKMEDLVKQVVAFYNISCYRIDAFMEAHLSNDSGKVSMPVIRVVGFFEDTVSNLTPILATEFELSAITDSNTLTNEMAPSTDRSFWVSLKANRLQLPEYRVFAGEKVEIRLSSVLQDVYASMQNELLKGKATIPANISRDLYRVGALIETADIELVKIKKLIHANDSTAAVAHNVQPTSDNSSVAQEPVAPPPFTKQIITTTNTPEKNNIETLDINVDSFNSLGVSISDFESINGNSGSGYTEFMNPPISEELLNNTAPVETPVTKQDNVVPETVALNIDNQDTSNTNVNGMIGKVTDTNHDSSDKNITEAPRVNSAFEELVQMNEAMLKEYVASSKLVKEVDRMIADRAGAKINDEIDIEGDVERLRFLKVFTLGHLQEKINDNKEDIIAFAEKWIGKDNGGSFDSGICLFYLEYLLVGKRNDPAFAVEYVLKFISDNDYSARYIIPTYNAIRQAAEPSNIAQATLK